MTLYKWSQTAAADANANSTINWAEGQAPSSVNDSARAMMAATAKYRDDISGAIVTCGYVDRLFGFELSGLRRACPSEQANDCLYPGHHQRRDRDAERRLARCKAAALSAECRVARGRHHSG